MIYAFITYSDIKGLFDSIGDGITSIIDALKTLVEGTITFIKWLPGIVVFYNSVVSWLIPQFAVVGLVVVTVYVIKIIVGGDNK